MTACGSPQCLIVSTQASATPTTQGGSLNLDGGMDLGDLISVSLNQAPPQQISFKVWYWLPKALEPEPGSEDQAPE